MTHPPSAPPAPPQPPARAPVPLAAPAPPLPEPPRRAAWAEAAARLRAAARTEPGRLRIIGSVVAGLLLLFGVLAFYEAGARAGAADTVRDRSQPLSADAAEIYRSLADANTTAAVGFLAGADEDPAVRERYERRIDNAARLVASAAAHGSPDATEYVRVLSEGLPEYTGLVETARANDRQGLPLGGAYLRHADQLMQETLLRAASDLYAEETERFRRDLAEARDWPWLATAAGVAALAALGWAQRRHFLRTNRVFSPGLVAATAAAAVLFGWLAGAHTLARGALADADRDAARSLSVLNDAWIAALQARGDESMTLVMRGAASTFHDSYERHMSRLAEGEDSALTAALDLADDAAGRAPVEAAADAVAEWSERHAEAREHEVAGRYEAALAGVIGPRGSTALSFDRVDAALHEAVEHEQRQFTRAADEGHGALGGLPAGALALALLGGLGALAGVGRRLSEYR
ncbi:hypothetical protein [Streptomyces marincola]|uniref:hypothetical protein n=1 Tax=Streptomyces marincola TaxID=2878388 RepID=UPI001CF5E96F|nr:hypothetical protein [Streptomyces marincola]UCM88114.1 hypothetical protein LC193_09190 [Streptomyces marincola]